MFSTDYWNNRMLVNGHTGHAEPFYYCFDQEARLFAFFKIINTLIIESNVALDYGCGSGDFIEILEKNFKNVVAYDVSEKIVFKAKQRFKTDKILVTSNIEEINNRQNFDLIITVTVLQTLNKYQLKSSLHFLKNKLSQN